MLVTKAKHNRIVRDLERNIDILNSKIKTIEAEKDDARFKLMEAKDDYEKKLKNRNDQIKKLSSLNENIESLAAALKKAHGANGGLKANINKKAKIISELKTLIKEKDSKIKELEKELKESKSDKYRVVHCRNTKNPKMETSRVIRGPKNAQVNKMLKEIGNDHEK